MSLLRVARVGWRGRAAWEGAFSLSPSSTLLPSSFGYQSRLAHTSTERSTNYKTLLLSVGGIAGFASVVQYLHSTSRAYCTHAPAEEQAPEEKKQPPLCSLPPITLYEYPACPFCSKVRAFLNYHNIQYHAVGVNPVSRQEVKFSDNKKVPFIVTEGQQIHDSSLVISVLRTCQIRGMSVSDCLQLYPEMTITDSKGKTTTERSNKYFVMYGEEPTSSSVGERREEREWRQWVDDHLVHALPPNIYRSLAEARQTMASVAGRSNLTAFQQFLARNVASVALYIIGKRNAKKYHLKSDVRESLYDYCNQWTRAIGKSRQFMGGSHPNLADLAVYGALSATEGLDTFRDMLTHTTIGPWYAAVKEHVNKH